MNVNAQRYVELCKQAGTLACFDIEASGLRGDYNSILVVSIKPFGKRPVTYKVTRPGHDHKLVEQVKHALEQYDIWVTYFGKGFDVPMINTRLLKWGIPPLEKRHHLDMYWMLKSNTLTARRSQGHLLAWLELPEQKMTISATAWNEVLADPKRNLPLMVKRCESDTRGLEALLRRTQHLIGDITR